MVVATQKRKIPGSTLSVPRSPMTAPREACPTMAVVPTAWGLCGVVWKTVADVANNGGFTTRPAAVLCRIMTPGLSHAELRRQLIALHPECHEVLGRAGAGGGRGGFHPEVVPEWFGELVRFLEGYYSNMLREWTQPQVVEHWAYWKPRMDWTQLTDFQRQVLKVVADIPCGTQMTYGQVAARIGKPAASRAVGAAIGSNPWPVLVPCHRVIGSNGQLTGFSAPGGVQTKRRMLELEGALPAETLFRRRR